MNLRTKLSEIKGVGEKTAAKFAAAGLETAGDLINFVPRIYEDFSHVQKISEITPGKITIRARAENVATKFVRRGMRITTATLADDSGKVQAVWFNQPYRENQLRGSREFFFSGNFALSRNRYQLTSPSVELASPANPAKIRKFSENKNLAQNNSESEKNRESSTHSGKNQHQSTARIVPIYPKKSGIKPATTRKILLKLKPLIAMLPENLPAKIVAKNQLISHSEALLNLHFPETIQETERAKKRLGFEEIFAMILAAKLNKSKNSGLRGAKITFSKSKIREFVENLPFELTAAQKKSLWEILQDFEKSTPMNRLLQGDVGSGKTVVAGAAAYQVALRGWQTAFMAPTEILAGQHFATLKNLLEPYGVKIALLTGSIKNAAREKILDEIKNGKTQIIVGTHALFQKTVIFKKLGFVVIDEQHRFGVKQRQDLLAKGEIMPHLLAMTATPIPRSLQLTIFGDLDISILNQLPKGRKPIQTEIISPVSRAKMNQKIREELKDGRQIYFIAPLISESEKSPENNQKFAKKLSTEKENVENLAKKVYAEFRENLTRANEIGVLHGKMNAESKEKIMRDFAAGEVRILVATTVVEVGVDVPNASVMVIENADGFGLAQLHQLRGRVGRGEFASFCFLVQSDVTAPSRRLREIANSNDGFHLAEIDLELRGAGEIYGIAQHGQMNFRFTNLADTKLIKLANAAAEEFLSEIAENHSAKKSHSDQKNLAESEVEKEKNNAEIVRENLAKYPELKREIEHYQRLTTLN